GKNGYGDIHETVIHETIGERPAGRQALRPVRAVEGDRRLQPHAVRRGSAPSMVPALSAGVSPELVGGEPRQLPRVPAGVPGADPPSAAGVQPRLPAPAPRSDAKRTLARPPGLIAGPSQRGWASAPAAAAACRASGGTFDSSKAFSSGSF